MLVGDAKEEDPKGEEPPMASGLHNYGHAANPRSLGFRSSSTRATRSIDKSDELYVRRRLKSATDLVEKLGRHGKDPRDALVGTLVRRPFVLAFVLA